MEAYQADQADQLDEIDKLYAKNHMHVIDKLLVSIMNVQIEVPRTVKQNIKPSIEDWDD